MKMLALLMSIAAISFQLISCSTNQPDFDFEILEGVNINIDPIEIFDGITVDFDEENAIKDFIESVNDMFIEEE